MLAVCYRPVRNKSCLSGSWNLENDTTHGQTGSTIHRRRPPADQSGKRVVMLAFHDADTDTDSDSDSPDTPTSLRPTRAISSRGCRACRAFRRGCHDATKKLLAWNLSLCERNAVSTVNTPPPPPPPTTTTTSPAHAHAHRTLSSSSDRRSPSSLRPPRRLSTTLETSPGSREVT